MNNLGYLGWAVVGFFASPAGVLWALVAMLFTAGKPWTVIWGGYATWTLESVIGSVVWLVAVIATSVLGAGIHAAVITGDDGLDATGSNIVLYVAWVLAWALSAGVFAWAAE